MTTGQFKLGRQFAMDAKTQLTQALRLLRNQTRKGHVQPAFIGQFNLILVRIHETLGLDLRALTHEFGDRRIQPPGLREPYDRRPITVTEYEQFLVEGDTFRTAVNEAIRRLDTYVPPKAQIGFVQSRLDHARNV